MMAKTKVKSKVRPLTAEESKAVMDKLDSAIKDFQGDIATLEQALGTYLVARYFGWKPLVLIHNKRTIRKFEEVLKIDFRTEFKDEEPDAERSQGYKLAKQLSNFWKAVSGETPIEGRREIA